MGKVIKLKTKTKDVSPVLIQSKNSGVKTTSKTIKKKGLITSPNSTIW